MDTNRSIKDTNRILADTNRSLIDLIDLTPIEIGSAWIVQPLQLTRVN